MLYTHNQEALSKLMKRLNAHVYVQKGQVDMQMISHDKEIYDIAWGGVGVFASVSADGSVRIFDVRYDSCIHVLSADVVL